MASAKRAAFWRYSVTSAAGTGTSVSVSLPKVYKAFLGMATNGQYGNLKEWSILTGLSRFLS